MNLANILPPAPRKVIYSILLLLTGVTPTVVSLLADGWQWDQDFPILLSSIVTASGFKMARDNTDTSE
jgi:uncharacterized membrane protein YwaF